MYVYVCSQYLQYTGFQSACQYNAWYMRQVGIQNLDPGGLKNTATVPKPYATDLRWRVIWLNIAHRRPSSEISPLMCISERSVWRYIDMFEENLRCETCNLPAQSTHAALSSLHYCD